MTANQMVHAQERASSSMAYMNIGASGHSSADGHGNSGELTLRSLEPQFLCTIWTELRRVLVREDVESKIRKIYSLRFMGILSNPCRRSYLVRDESGPYGRSTQSQTDIGHGHHFLCTVSAHRS